MEQTIKAIETAYKGYRFRSRLEARWAVFFDTVGVPWEYEKEGYDLGEAGLYLPDFWLPAVGLRRSKETGLWVEIKGQMPTDEESEKCGRLVMMTEAPVILFAGLPGEDNNMQNESGYEFTFWIDDDGKKQPERDSYMTFMRCGKRTCRHLKIEFGDSNYMECPICGSDATNNERSLVAGYAAARSARFEYGEKGIRP